MKILLLTDLYPVNTGETTTPVTLHNFVIEWKNLGHRVDVVKPNFILNSFLRRKPFYKTGFYEFEGVKILNVNYFSPFFFDVTKKIPKEFNIADYDILIAHMPSGIIFANKLTEKFNKPLICGIHCSDIDILTKHLYSIYFKKQLESGYKKAKKIACRSFVLQKKFHELMPECADKTFVASSGIKTDYSDIEKFKSPTLKVLTCANLIKRKNIDKLIEAIGGLECFELKIIGDGKELKRLKKKQKKFSKKQNIQFLGRLTRIETMDEMKRSDIFILPSVNETFGMVYLEAMASGCITVCTKNDGIDGIIKDEENGFLTEVTVQGIKKTLLKIKNSENIEKILQNSKATINELSPQNCAQKYLDNIK